MLERVRTAPLELVLAHLGLRADRTCTVGDPARAPGRTLLAGVRPGDRGVEAAAGELLALAGEGPGPALLLLEGDREERELARWRNALWPVLHVGALYRLSHKGIVRESLGGTEALRGATGIHGVLLVAERREAVLAPDTTVAKFDKNAAGWDGDPSSPGYPHFRWMRRFVGTFAPADRLRGAKRILDFGCGAGWVGIEAALAAPGAELCAFDPSPEMVKLAEGNARASGIARFASRTGFGEDPPFPAAGEAPFDLVLSSGVLSFAPDPERWLDGLARTVAPGGTLVIGDLNRESKGMRRRRETKPLLPVREMNARTREEVRAALEWRGFRFEAWAGYQLTSPVPELMHWSERKLGGALSGALLRWNRLRSGAPDHPERFDSWVIRFARG